MQIRRNGLRDPGPFSIVRRFGRGRIGRVVNRRPSVAAVQEGDKARQDAQRIHVRMLALAGAHADGREALEQLDVVEAFLHRILEILELQVFVELDEILARLNTIPAGATPDRIAKVQKALEAVKSSLTQAQAGLSQESDPAQTPDSAAFGRANAPVMAALNQIVAAAPSPNKHPLRFPRQRLAKCGVRCGHPLVSSLLA